MKKIDEGLMDALIADRDFERNEKRRLTKKETTTVSKPVKKKTVNNEKIMDDIKKFMDKLQSKPDGTIMKRNDLEIRKDNQFEFGIYYMIKGFDGKY